MCASRRTARLEEEGDAATRTVQVTPRTQGSGQSAHWAPAVAKAPASQPGQGRGRGRRWGAASREAQGPTQSRGLRSDAAVVPCAAQCIAEWPPGQAAGSVHSAEHGTFHRRVCRHRCHFDF